MCTLIVLHRREAEVPLLLAANRDEYLDRPTEGLALRRAGALAVVAPRDLHAGGSWLGVNQAGVFAGLTNRPAPRDEARRSRGHLVMEALGCASALDAVRALESIPVRAYNPFNLFVADARDAFAIVYEDKAAVAELSPAVHVIGNADPDDCSHPKVASLMQRAETVDALPSEQRLAGLAALCRSHEGVEGPLGKPCVHAGDYGTRSSTLLRLARDPADRQLCHADGPPCETDYQDHSHLLRALDGSGVEAPDARRER